MWCNTVVQSRIFYCSKFSKSVRNFSTVRSRIFYQDFIVEISKREDSNMIQHRTIGYILLLEFSKSIRNCKQNTRRRIYPRRFYYTDITTFDQLGIPMQHNSCTNFQDRPRIPTVPMQRPMSNQGY